MSEPSREESIFLAAREQPDGRQRADYLESACEGDPDLRTRVEELLRLNDQSQGPLDAPPMGLATMSMDTLGEEPGDQIGPYKIREQIGEGGFGVVYVAVQERPVRRKVALKIIKPGMDTKDVIARFEAEQQALALMDHPNVAKVLDAGSTESGRPYFVMELVHGVKITEFCDKNRLSMEDRLKLFIDVCHAVQHAHHKGIIHRDLKPNNILVTLHDGKPVPKVIDFGVAKALSQQLTEKTIYTSYGQMIGTPEYMSPEQAEMSGLGIDTRSDIYSLGVLLYELLVGQPPFEAKRLRASGFEGILKIIREEEPPKPSTKVSTMGQEATVIAEHRRTDVAKLRQCLQGELDWIVMKALDKDRGRRYETANGFAMDVERYLKDDPVHACPPSTAYKLRKFARRNKGPVAAAAALLAALCLGLVGTTIGLVWATREAKRAGDAEELANGAREEALELAAKNEELAGQEQAAHRKEQAARREAEYGSYILQMNLAAANLDRGNEMVARNALLAAPPEFRNWEWGYLIDRAWPAQIELDDTAVVARGPETSDAAYWAAAPARVIRRLDHQRHTRLASVAFNLHGLRLATTTADGSVRLWNARTGDLSVDMLPLGTILQGLDFSHDNSRVAVGDTGGIVFMLNPATKKVLWKQPVPSEDSGSGSNLHVISKLWFSPDDTRLLVAHFDGTVRVWEAESGHFVRSFREHPMVVQSLQFNEASGSVMTASRDGSVRVWDIDIAQESRTPRFAPRQAGISVQSISPDLRHVATGYYDGTVVLWNLETGEERNLHSGRLEVYDLLFSPDGTCLIATIGGESVRVLDVASGSEIGILEGALAARPSVAVSFDGSRIVTNSTDGITRIWAPVPIGVAEPVPFENAHTDTVIQAAFDSDGRRIVSASYDTTVKVWDADSQELITTFDGHKHELLTANFSPDGNRVASVSSRGTVRVWDVGTGRELFLVPGSDEFFRTAASEGGLRGNILGFSADFSASPFVPPTGDKLVAYDSGELVVIDSSSGKRLAILPGNSTVCWPVIGPMANHVATITATSNDTNVWDLNSMQKLHTLSGHVRQADWAVFNRGGTKLLTSSMDKTTFLWDVESGKPLHHLEGHEGNVVVSRFSPDETRIATASVDGTARIWDVETGEQLSTFSGHTNRLTNVEYSPDGTRLFSTAVDNTARVWDPTGPVARELVVLRGTSKLVYATWSPDGRKILTCWYDGSMRLSEAFPWANVDADVDMGEQVRAWRDGRMATRD